MSSSLRDLIEVVELCDVNGKVLGKFTPHWDMADWEPITPDISEEELRRREQETEVFSSAEALAYMERLKCIGSNEKKPSS
jgi:hypothetical protein